MLHAVGTERRIPHGQSKRQNHIWEMPGPGTADVKEDGDNE